MANLPETPVWETGIYQLEETDPVQGGPNGIDNQQGKQLANRTAWLKSQVETLGTGKQPLDATLTAIAALNGVADRIAYFTGPDTVALTPLTAFIRTLLDDGDASAARSTLGAISQAQLDAAISALVNSSPATLDTLNELAAALGNDANFATTVTNALAAKAPIASPVFTGDPKAPTPAQFDNDTSLATTEFVQRALGNFSAYAALSNAQVLDSGAIGKFHNISAGVTSFTLPSLSGLPTGASVSFINTSNADCTINRSGTDTIATNNSTVNSLVVKNGDSVIFVKATASLWFAIGTAALQGSASFSSSIAASGYQKLPSGLIIQWGNAGNIASASSVAVTYPIAFPNGALSASATVNTATNTATPQGAGIAYTSASQLTIRNLSASTLGFTWIAIGY